MKIANIAGKLEMDDRIEAMALKSSYITLKDHKEDWPARLHCRLINPTKSNLGSISKSVLDRINGEVRKATKLTLWRNTKEVIQWFNNLPEKNNLRWLKFDVEAFYPSISKELLKKAILYAKTITTISDREDEIISHCRR